ncbi:MAG: hypothetical protein ABEL51_06475 [Salinibacter sp.]
MSGLHRTQILLEETQYRRLRRHAREEGLSLFALLRQILDEHFAEVGGDRPRLQDLAGMGDDPEIPGRDHDRVLYDPRA